MSKGLPAADRGWHVVFSVLGILISIGWIAVAQEEASDLVPFTHSDDVRIRVRDLGAESGGRAFLKVDFPDDPSAALPIPLRAEVLAPDDLGIIEAVFRLSDERGQPVADTTIKTSAAPGSTPLHYTWEATKAQDGEYFGSIEIFQRGAKSLARREFVITKRSGAGVESALKQAYAALADLKGYVNLDDDDAGGQSYLESRLAILEEALRRVEEVRDDWFMTYDLAAYVLETTEKLHARWALEGVSGRSESPLEVHDLGSLTRADGAFRAKGRPVFLAGLVADDDASSLERIAEYGLSFAALYEGPEAEVAETGLRLEELVKSAAEHNLALLPVLSGRDRSAEELATLARSLGSGGTLLALGLVVQGTLDIAGPSLREGFIEQVKATYKDRYELNRMWRKRFEDFDEIEVWPEYERRSYQYDWQTYQRRLKTDHAINFADGFGKAVSAAPIALALRGDFIQPGETRHGIDHEALGEAFDIGVLTTWASFGHPVFGMNYPEQSMVQALRRSFAPQAPLIVVHRIDFGGVKDVYERDVAKDVQAYVWESAVEGVAALALDIRQGSKQGGAPGAVEFRALQGLVTAAHDIDRVAGVIEAFRRDTATVAILWSDSARILDDGAEHLASVRRAYEGSSFAGHRVRFLSERQLERGEWDGMKLLIIPETPALSKGAFIALQKLIDTGIGVIRSMKLTVYDSRGAAQNDVISFGPETVLARGADASTEYMEAMDEVLSRGSLPIAPRVVNHFGYPVEGVKTRYTEVDGAGYLYVINLRKDPVTCDLSTEEKAGWDLIHGREVDFPRALEPLRPMLIRLGWKGPISEKL